jgi:hypothetical protein
MRRMQLFGNSTHLDVILSNLYAIVNNIGVRQVFTPAVWNITMLPIVHIFLWLLANNKTLTRDNLAKRRKVDDETC